MSISSSDDYIEVSAINELAEDYEDAIAVKQDEIEAKEFDIELVDLDNEYELEDLEDYQSELKILRGEKEGLEEEAEEIFRLREECAGYPSGRTLINEGVWDSYALQLAEDILGSDAISNWPCSAIDWGNATAALAIDYSTITWEGTDFYIQS